MEALPRVCVIGAGSSGIAVVKALNDLGLPVTCYEAGTEVGGNWCIRNPNGMSAAYESLHINTDSRLMEYRDFPMPPDAPDYPSHRYIKDYFDAYVDHFGLRPQIRFGARVTRAQPATTGGWAITLESGERVGFDALVVASGHHWDPSWPHPAYPGEFDGCQIHAHAYLNPAEPVDCRGRRVLVVGLGNSAMDIACELSRPGLAERLFLSARHGAWILPKYLFGVPTSRLARLPHWLPWRLSGWLISAAVAFSRGTPWRFGLPRPEQPLLASHPTISEEIFLRLGSGDVIPRPGIDRLEGDDVRFVDGTREAVDVIIWCTGYRVSFPFFDPGFISAPGNDLPLWERLIHPDVPALYFAGLLQPLGAVMPLAEAQGRFIAEHLAGRIRLPSPETMRADMDRERRASRRRYRDGAERHTMQVDFAEYLHRLQRQSLAGRRRAVARAGPSPDGTAAGSEPSLPADDPR